LLGIGKGKGITWYIKDHLQKMGRKDDLQKMLRKYDLQKMQK